jgi:hypothetical protein
VDPVPDAMLLRKSGSAGNRNPRPVISNTNNGSNKSLRNVITHANINLTVIPKGVLCFQSPSKSQITYTRRQVIADLRNWPLTTH